MTARLPTWRADRLTIKISKVIPAACWQLVQLFAPVSPIAHVSGMDYSGLHQTHFTFPRSGMVQQPHSGDQTALRSTWARESILKMVLGYQGQQAIGLTVDSAVEMVLASHMSQDEACGLPATCRAHIPCHHCTPFFQAFCVWIWHIKKLIKIKPCHQTSWTWVGPQWPCNIRGKSSVQLT